MPNPDWTRDELILALDVYFRNDRRQLDASHPDIIALSELLNQLPVHDNVGREKSFRNPNGVSMKLGNFARFDPSYAGQGLRRGNRLEGVVWKDFSSDPDKLRSVAKAIAAAAENPAAREPEGEEEEFAEGRLLTRLHVARERNATAVRKKKLDVLKATGRLACECCGFDFKDRYGQLGMGFAECHHTVPVSKLREGQKTRLTDLAIVCANCHRMLHRGEPLISVAELRESVIRLPAVAS